MENTAVEILKLVQTGLIDANIDSREEYRPKLVYNDNKKGNSVLVNLEKELMNCDSFWFSAAFITRSGLCVLKQALIEAQDKGIKGKIITTDYLAFNEPDALRELRKFSNLEVKVFTKEHFHTKGYMFTKQDVHTFIVGSSNLTQYALKENKEWIQGYEEYYKKSKKIREQQKVVKIKQRTLQPNAMQIVAIRNLDALREDGKNKALLISAMGERVIIVTGRRSPVKSRAWAA